MFEQLCAGIDTLAKDLESKSTDRQRTQRDLKAKIVQLRAMGKPVPDRIVKIEYDLDLEEMDDLYDNVPV